MTNLVRGTLAFFNRTKGFGIVRTDVGDVFLHATKAGAFLDQLVDGASVEIDVVTRFELGEYKRSAARVMAVSEPQPIMAYGCVKWYDAAKGFGYISLVGEFAGQDARINRAVIDGSGFDLAACAGMPVRVTIEPNGRGYGVTAFASDEAIVAAYSAIVNTSQLSGWLDGHIKWFNTAKKFGFIRVGGEMDGEDFFLHISTVQRLNLSVHALQPDHPVRFRHAPNLRGKREVQELELLESTPGADAVLASEPSSDVPAPKTKRIRTSSAARRDKLAALVAPPPTEAADVQSKSARPDKPRQTPRPHKGERLAAVEVTELPDTELARQMAAQGLVHVNGADKSSTSLH